MKKIAIPSDGENFAQHFGHCLEFTIFETEGRKIIKKEKISNPGHEPGYLPRFLKELGVDCILAGGMGSRAKDLFDSNGIEVVIGAMGKVDEGINLYLEGKLETGNNICDH